MRFSAMICAIALAWTATAQEPAFYPVDKLQQESTGIPAQRGEATGALHRLATGTTGALTAGISDNGLLRDIARGDGARLHPGFTESYTIQYADGRTQTISEADLTVGPQREIPGGVEVEATSPAFPGFRWTKRFLRLDGRTLAKEVTIEGGGETVLLTMNAVAENPPEHPGAYVWNSPFGYYPPESPSYFPGVNQSPGAPYLLPVRVYPDWNTAVGFYIDTINGRAIHPRETAVWLQHEKDSESLPFVGEFLGADGRRSLSYRWLILAVDGSGLDFDLAVQSRPEYAALMDDLPAPEWMDRVLMATDCGSMDLLGWDPKPPYRDLTGFDVFATLPEDEAIVWTIFSWGTLGGVPTEGEWQIYEPRPMAMTAEGVRHIVDGLRTGSADRIRVALYDWNLSFDPALPPYNDPAHRDWAAHQADGNFQSSWACGTFPQWWPKVDAQPNYLNPGYLDFYLGQIGKQPDVYGTQAVYIDAEVGQCYADWSTHTWFHPYDQYEFKKKYRLASGQNLPLIKNSPNAPYVSGGYWEGRGLVPAAEAETRWREVGAKIFNEKIWQWDHNWTALMGGNRSDREPNYSNYVIGLGFKPHAMNLQQDYARLRAAWDMRHSRVQAHEFSPCFWRDEPTEIEAYLLAAGHASVFSIVDHRSGPEAGQSASLSVQTFGLNGTGDGRLYVYTVAVDTAGDTMPDPADAAALRTWRIAQRGPLLPYRIDGDRLSFAPELTPRELTLAVITDLPVTVVGHGDETVQLPLPGTADVELNEHKVDGSRHTVTVRSRHGAHLAGLVDWSAHSIDDQPVIPEADGTILIPAGEHRLAFTVAR